MAQFNINLRSNVLQLETQLLVTFPDSIDLSYKRPLKVLYLLHGLSNNASSWTRQTSIERYAQERNIVVIMPEVQKSFYQNMKYGCNYLTYIAEELPELCKYYFGLNPDREDTYVVGLSMGGYGALEVGLAYPERFSAAGSLSGAVDLNGLAQYSDDMPELRQEFKAIFGVELQPDPKSDIYFLLDKVSNLPANQRPKIYMTCGKQDFLHDANITMRDYIKTLPYEYCYEEFDGEHTWAYWDKTIQNCLDYFLNK